MPEIFIEPRGARWLFVDPKGKVRGVNNGERVLLSIAQNPQKRGHIFITVLEQFSKRDKPTRKTYATWLNDMRFVEFVTMIAAKEGSEPDVRRS